MSGKQNSLNLSSFCGFIEKFQLSFNLVEFSVKWSFSRILRLNFQLARQNSRVEFHLILIDFCKVVL